MPIDTTHCVESGEPLVDAIHAGQEPVRITGINGQRRAIPKVTGDPQDDFGMHCGGRSQQGQGDRCGHDQAWQG